MDPQKTGVLTNGLVAYDFIPVCTKPASTFNFPQFEPFSTLQQSIDEFLLKSSNLRVKFCETVLFIVGKKGVKSNHSNYHPEPLASPSVKAARIWVESRQSSGQPDRIAFMTFVPELSSTKLTNLDELTNSVNEYLQKNPLPGKIITVESLQMRGVKEGPVDVDVSCYKPKASLAQLKTGAIRMFRIWYRVGPEARETIGFADFMHDQGQDFEQSDSSRRYKVSYIQGSLDLVSRVGDWASKLPGNTSIVNITTLSVPAKMKGEPTDLHSVFYWMEMGPRDLRYLRVAFVTSQPAFVAPPTYEPRVITTRFFSPALLRDPGHRKGLEFEDGTATKIRLFDWIAQTGANVLAVETAICTLRPKREYEYDSVATWNGVHVDYLASHGYDDHDDETTWFHLYLVCYRVYVQVSASTPIMDPPQFVWPRTIEDYHRDLLQKRLNPNASCSLQ